MESFIWNSFELVEDCFLFKVVFVRSSSNRCAICFVHVSRKKKRKNICICHLHDGEMNYGAGIRWPAISQTALSSCKATCFRRLNDRLLFTVTRILTKFWERGEKSVERNSKVGWNFLKFICYSKFSKKNSNLFFALQVKKLWKIHWSCRIDKIDCYESV